MATADHLKADFYDMSKPANAMDNSIENEGAPCAINGPSPLVNVEGVLAKVEWVHATGSIKDRIAQYILCESEKQGLLRPGMRIVEATSGNTGIAFAYHAKRLGYPVTIIMPEHMSPERVQIMRALGGGN